jgi:4-amino-4-deoxy-L-arabinose transferase-like glycosyltransferase
MLLSVPVYFIVFPFAYVGVVRSVAGSLDARLEPRTHLKIFVGVAVVWYLISFIFFVPQPPSLSGAIRTLIPAAVLIIQSIVFFEIMELVRLGRTKKRPSG